MKQLSCICCEHFNDCADSKNVGNSFDCHRFTILPCLRRWYYGTSERKTINEIELVRGTDEEIISYQYLGYHFLTLQDAEALRDLHIQLGISHKDMNITIMHWLIGIPRFIDVQTSFETGILAWYN